MAKVRLGGEIGGIVGSQALIMVLDGHLLGSVLSVEL